MSSVRKFILIVLMFIVYDIKAQQDTIKEINNVFPFELLSILYKSDFDGLKLFCVDDNNSAELQKTMLYGHEIWIIKTFDYTIIAEITDKLYGKKIIWRFYINFKDKSKETKLLSLFPYYAGYSYNAKDDTFYSGFQTIGKRNFYNNPAGKLIEFWLHYPPLD